jgi:uncharacterized protein YndB with AHSA1/START domain
MKLAPLQITTPTDTTIVMVRTFGAPRRLVWAAMTEPDKMRRWMLPPPGFTTTVCEVEPRVGGALRIAWKTADADPAMTLAGTFSEFAPHTRMVHDEVMTLGTGEVIGSLVETHEFFERGDLTEVRITQTYASAADRDGALDGGVAGMEACYLQLDALLRSA